MLYQEYYRKVLEVFEKISATQGDKIKQAADVIAKAVLGSGLIYVFGCGHSHKVAEDLFYRAGDFAPVCAILDSALMLHDGAVKSSYMERMTGIAGLLLERHGVCQKDVLIVVSNSGINAVPVEMAMCAQAKKVPVIAISYSSYYEDPPRHMSGRKLYQCADIAIDNCVCHGDASVSVGDSGLKAGPISTLAGCMIGQSIMVQAAENIWKAGKEPPLYVSGNIAGGVEKKHSVDF